MARKTMNIDFMRIAKTTAGGAAVSLAEDTISKMVPMINNNPMVQKLLPLGIGLAIDMVLPNQPEIANGCYGAAGYKLGKHFAPKAAAINGTTGAINGTPGANNGSAESNRERLKAVQAKAQKQISVNGATENYAQQLREKKYGFR